jgi:hypothetical protein
MARSSTLKFVPARRLPPATISRTQLIEPMGLPLSRFRAYRRSRLIGAPYGRGPTTQYDSGEIPRLRLVLFLVALKIPRKSISKFLNDLVLGQAVDVAHNRLSGSLALSGRKRQVQLPSAEVIRLARDFLATRQSNLSAKSVYRCGPAYHLGSEAYIMAPSRFITSMIDAPDAETDPKAGNPIRSTSSPRAKT